MFSTYYIPNSIKFNTSKLNSQAISRKKEKKKQLLLSMKNYSQWVWLLVIGAEY